MYSQEMGVSGSDTHEAMGALPVIVLNGDNSSPSVPAGTGGPKSNGKGKGRVLMYLHGRPRTACFDNLGSGS